MKKSFIFLISLVVSLVLLDACSTKKNTFISRNYQALTTKYNVLFNGQQALEKGIASLNENYKDDWFEILPIETIKFEGNKVVLRNMSINVNSGFKSNTNSNQNTEQTPFEKAEEKAVKAIQKHSMNFNGLERNRKIDDAYLLLGKARYYSQRFIPAIEAFNYVIANYPDADLIAETKIWRAKANVRNDNEERAIETMNLLLYVKDTLETDVSDRIKEQAHTAMAMAYMKTDTLQKAIKHLQLATRTLKLKDQGARNLFVLGQVYANRGDKDSAVMVFKRLVDFKQAPKKYQIHGEIELAKNTTSDSVAVLVMKRLDDLIKDRENRKFLDELYFQRAVLHETNDSVALAVEDYNRSLRSTGGGKKQRTFTHERLGNLYFNKANYSFASAHYDSVLQFAENDRDLRIRRVMRKSKNLAELIKNEQIVSVNDSILTLANLSVDDQKAYFETYVAKLKKADEELAQLLLNRANFSSSNSLQSTKKQGWYFYNPQVLKFGKSEFKKFWGTRRLEDNWRWSTKRSARNSENDENKEVVNNRYNVDGYVAQIPTDKSVLDSLYVQRNQALYDLGLIYKEQFKNSDLAIKRFERLEKLSPAKELILPLNWHLYQIYKSSDAVKSEKYKNTILSNYPETVFAKVIQNPDGVIENEVEEDVVEQNYKELYYLYKNNKFETVITKVDSIIPKIQGNDLERKYQLLKALTIGKHQNKEAYKKALKFVFVNYGNFEEGKKAKEILQKLD